MIKVYEHKTLKDICGSQQNLFLYTLNPVINNSVFYQGKAVNLNQKAKLLWEVITKRVYNRFRFNEVYCYSYIDGASTTTINNYMLEEWEHKFADKVSNVLDRYVPMIELFEANTLADLVKDSSVNTDASNNSQTTATGTDVTTTEGNSKTTGNDYRDITKIQDTPTAANSYGTDEYTSEYRETVHKQDETLNVDTNGKNTLVKDDSSSVTGSNTSTVTYLGDLINKFLAYKESLDEPSVYERMINEMASLFGEAIYE